SYFDQMPEISRDQDRTDKAVQGLEEVVRKYPESEYAVAAKRKIEVARDQLAGKEMDIGRQLQNTHNYVGAINRFKVVVTRYQRTRHVEEALLRLTEVYMALGIVEEAQTSAAVLGHNFPESRWYKDAYALMQSKGVEPNENKGSWISQAFAKLASGKFEDHPPKSLSHTVASGLDTASRLHPTCGACSASLGPSSSSTAASIHRLECMVRRPFGGGLRRGIG